MKHTSPKHGNHSRTGKYDAYIIPDPENSHASFELTVLDQEIPSFEITPNKPGNQPSSAVPFADHSDPDRPRVPSYATGGASGFIVPKPKKNSPQTPVSSIGNDAPVSFEILPDFTRNRSFRHYDVAPPPPIPHAPADTEVHIPVADTPSPAPTIILKNDLSSYWKQPPAAFRTITPDAAAPALPPVSKSPGPGTTAPLSPPASPEHSTGTTLPTHPGSGINFYRHDTTSRVVTAPLLPVENRPVDHMAITPGRSPEEIVMVPLGSDSDLAELESAAQAAVALQIPDKNNPVGPHAERTTITSDRPADTEVHFPVVDALPPAPPSYRKKYLSTRSNQPPATASAGQPDTAHHAHPPATKSPVLHTPTILSPTATPARPAVEASPAPTGSGNNPAKPESPAQAVVAPLPATEKRPIEPPIDQAGCTAPELTNPEALDEALQKLIHTIPLLSEDEILTSLSEPQYGGFMISLKTLKQALIRTGLETDYKRYSAYITG